MIGSYGIWLVVPMSAGVAIGLLLNRYRNKNASIKNRTIELSRAVYLARIHKEALAESRSTCRWH